MGSAAWLLLGLVVSADHGFSSFSVSAEARGSASFQDGTTGATVTPELSVQPTADLGWVAGALKADLGYHPLLTVTNATPALLHRLQATGEWRLSPSRRALVDQQLSFGQYDTSLGSLGQAGDDPFPKLLGLGIVDYLTSDTAAGFDGALVPRLRLRASAGYHVSGGLTETARQGLPLQQGPRLTLELQHEATRRDSVSGYLKLSGGRFSVDTGDRLAGVAEGGVTWRSTLTRDLGMTLAAGAAAASSEIIGGVPTRLAAPVGSAGLSYGAPRLRFTVDANYAPQVDAQTGTIFYRAGVSASSEYHPRGDLTARASFGGSWSVAGDNAGDRSLLGEASLAWHERNLEVSGGVRAADATQSSAHATELRTYVAFSLKTAAVR